MERFNEKNPINSNAKRTQALNKSIKMSQVLVILNKNVFNVLGLPWTICGTLKRNSDALTLCSTFALGKTKCDPAHTYGKFTWGRSKLYNLEYLLGTSPSS